MLAKPAPLIQSASVCKDVSPTCSVDMEVNCLLGTAEIVPVDRPLIGESALADCLRKWDDLSQARFVLLEAQAISSTSGLRYRHSTRGLVHQNPA
jgi:hypothetical protein